MKIKPVRPGPVLLLSVGALALFLGGCSKEAERNLTPVMVARTVGRTAQGGLQGAPKGPAAPAAKGKAATPAPPAKAVPPVPAAAAKDNALLLSPAPPPPDLYISVGKRNPFLPYIRTLKEGKARDLQKVPPLQRADISEFRYVGILKTRKGVHALLETNDGKGYDVQVGTRLGRENGVVMAITSKEIAIREETVDSVGNPVVRDVLIKNKNANAGGKQ